MGVFHLALGTLEAALNHYLALEPEARGRLAELHGRVVALEILGLGLTLYLVPAPNGIQVLDRVEGEPDAILTGTPLGLARLGASRDKAGELFSGQVRVRGDTELGQGFSELLGAVEVDWEELLARLTGDVAAHQIGRGLRTLGRRARETRRTLEQDLTEYLQEEARLLPGLAEIEAFQEEVDVLREDTDRLEARVQRLERLVHDPDRKLAR
jgi:ubiquinone biosynthesis protein UbiJ